MTEELIFMTSNAEKTGNVMPLLHQIRHALSQLIERQEQTRIDLRRLPLSASEEAQLEAFLGHGEVKADIQALGDTVLIESRYAGVFQNRILCDGISQRFLQSDIPVVIPSSLPLNDAAISVGQIHEYCSRRS